MRFPSMAGSFAARLCAIAGLVAIVGLGGCTTTGKPVAPPAAPVQTVQAPPTTNPTHPLDSDQPNFLRLGNTGSHTPVRVGVLLPFGSSVSGTRALANTMLKAAELAMFDSGNRDIILMTADEGSSGDAAAAAARKLLDEGAEVIIGPLYAASVRAVAPVTRDRAVPLISFSTDRSVAGDGVYLLSFQPEDLVGRVVRFAASTGHKNLGALVPSTAYGDVVSRGFKDAVAEAGATVADVQSFAPDAAGVVGPATIIAKSNADAILIGQGGAVLKAAAAALRANGADAGRVKLLGTGLWDDPSIQTEAALDGAWFAAPSPNADDAFAAKYKAAYGASPPQLAGLAYDAVSLIAILASGTPYHRFTPSALTDPNGFTGVNGIFRFLPDGTIERGLAVLGVTPGGFTVIDPAPRTFERPGS